MDYLSSPDNNPKLRTDVSFPMIASEFITSGADYCTLFEPTATNIAKEGNGYILEAVGNLSGYVPYTCFTATQSYLKNHDEQAEKFLRAVHKGYTYLATQTPENRASALAPSFPSMTTEELKVAVEQYIAIDAWSSDLILKESSFETMLDIINSTQGKALGTTYSADYNKIIDNSIARKLASN